MKCVQVSQPDEGVGYLRYLAGCAAHVVVVWPEAGDSWLWLSRVSPMITGPGHNGQMVSKQGRDTALSAHLIIATCRKPTFLLFSDNEAGVVTADGCGVCALHTAQGSQGPNQAPLAQIRP